MRLKHRLCAGALALVLMISAAPAAQCAGSYLDVPEGHWATTYIESARTYGIMEGMGNNEFGLGQTITRGQFAALLRKFFAWTPVSTGESHFTDVSASAWYYSDVETVYAQGILDEGTSFRPDDNITREEMAVLLIRALGYQELAEQWVGQEDCPFTDVTRNQGYITMAYDFGMVTGVGDGLFLPNSSATREQAAAMMVRVYERYSSRVDWLHGFYALSAYSQLSLTDELDGVSVGWAKLELNSSGVPYINDQKVNSNDWVKPSGAQEVLDHLSAANVPCNLNVYGSDKSILSTAELRTAAVKAMVNAASGYAGLTIDIEGIKANNKENFTALMTELRAALPADKTLYVCVQPNTWYDGYDFRALGELCDKVIMMAHDYEWSVPAYYVGTSKTENPGAPLTKIYDTLQALTDPDTGVQDRSKLALAISIASVGLSVDGNGLLTSQKLYHPAPSTIITRLRQSDTQFGYSALYGMPYIYYTDGEGNRYRLWYEDAQSVTAKVQLARMFGINGISLWRLGNIPTYDDVGLNYDVWSALLALS
jgi:hypothetical protein